MNQKRIVILVAFGLALAMSIGVRQLALATQTVSVTREHHQPAAPGQGYVGFSTTDDLAVFDLDGSALPGSIDLLPEGNYPYDVSLSPDEQEAWIVGASGDGVIVIDTTSNTISQRIGPVGDYPVDVTFSKGGNYAFVAGRNTDTIAVISTTNYAVVDTYVISSTLTNQPSAGKMALNACTGDIYMVDWYKQHLFMIDPITGEMKAEFEAGTSLWDLTLSPDAATLYVTDRGEDVVHVIDTATFSVTADIPVGDDPWGIDITPDGKFLFVANEDSHSVTVIDTTTNTAVTTISLPAADADPRDLDISSDGAYAYVPSGSISGPDAVYVIDTVVLAVTDAITFSDTTPGVTANPNALAVAPELNNLDPVAGFTTTAPVPLHTPVQFFDTSSNVPTSWNWDFGDGLGSSTLQNPVYNYLNPGTYTVTLTVGNVCGGTTIQDAVTVLPPPVALTIGKIGPPTAVSGQPITYTLTVTNSGTDPAANLVITDRVPAAAAYVSGGTLVSDTVQWQVAGLPAGMTTTVQLVVTATQTITNSTYGVVADGGFAAPPGAPVVTVIEMAYPLYLPVAIRP